MTWFDGFRNHKEPSWFELRDIEIVDVKFLAIILVGSLSAVAIIMLVIGTKGKEKWMTFLKAFLSLFCGSAILISLTSDCWMTGRIRAVGQYIPTCDLLDVDGRLTISVGLKMVDVQLKGQVKLGQDISDNVDHKETITWNSVEEPSLLYINAYSNSKPVPIIKILEYFSIDAGELRWMRDIRLAGNFVRVLIWSSLVSWLMANIYLVYILKYGTFMGTLTGILMSGSCCLYHLLQPRHELLLPVDGTIVGLQYGWCYWLTLSAGILTLVCCIIAQIFWAIYPYKSIIWMSMYEQVLVKEAEKFERD